MEGGKQFRYRLGNLGSRALANLRAAFGDCYSDEERRPVVRDFFRAPRLARETRANFVQIEAESSVQLPPGGTGAMVVSTHFGNSERGHLGIAFRGYSGSQPHLRLWAYEHWRFRPSQGRERYPFSANIPSGFDRALATPLP